MNLESPISVIKNIGQRRLALLNKLNIFTINDLLSYYPRDYEDRSQCVFIKDVVLGQNNIIKAKITSGGIVLNSGGMLITKFLACDDTGEIEVVWYNQPYLKNQFKQGTEYIFVGKIVLKYNKYQIQSPDYELISLGKELLSGGRIVPVYTLPTGISQKMFRGYIKQAIDNLTKPIEENLPLYILQENNLMGKHKSIINIHFPENDENFQKARQRLVFEELFVMQLFLMHTKGEIKRKKKGIFFDDLNEDSLLTLMPFDLTKDQKSVLQDIKEDIQSGYMMNRLLQGDVGSGKTAVAMLCCFFACKNNFQAALMAPTEVLAKQHYDSFIQIFEKLNISIVLLTGSMKKREKDITLSKIKNGEANIIIGTHAIIQDKVEFCNLGFVICDEQHRFGVRQRETFNKKGQYPHVLVMTATPIPRTLALILYGDLDISSIENLPPGRQKIDTYAVNTNYRKRIYDFIKKELDQNRQAYIICPMIDENENIDLESVIQYTENLQKGDFIGYNLSCLHGKMKQAEKDAIMMQFIHGEIQIMISTTVIEVGINVPNATVMLIENADRFGLSQLHQLRGRVGRGKSKSYCILISDSKSKLTKSRLEAMVKSSSGFEISRLDLELRGPGDFFGTRQHGLPEMKIANLYEDIDVLKLAQRYAEEIYSNDQDFTEEKNKTLKASLKQIITVL